MTDWLGIALVAYAIGAAIEGVNAANQLAHSSLKFGDRKDDTSASPTPSQEKWQVFAAIATVSVCGAFLWPCRLIHRSFKGSQNCSED